MKRAYLQEVARKHSNRIFKYMERLPGSFATEDIHDLRVEYKKLRAFLRMLEYDARRAMLMPAALKAIYNKAGEVRDLQLYIPNLQEVMPEEGICLMIKKKQLFVAKEKLLKAIEKGNAAKQVDTLLEHLPDALTDEGIRHFIHHKVAALRILLMLPEEDEELHSIRKILKDILYNIRIFNQDWGISFPIPAWKSEKALDEVALTLGDYNDRCMMLDKQDNDIISPISPDEQRLLIDQRDHWIAAKRNSKQVLLEQLQHLKLVSDF